METLSSRHTMAERPHREMMEKSHFRETFFAIKSVAQQRPDSVHTEFMETDWDEEDILSDLEDDIESSPRHSIDSSGRPSVTTISTHDEIRTPDQRSFARFDMGPDPMKPIVGPRGPHLFRSSISSTSSFEFHNALSLSPITPKAPGSDAPFQLPISLDLDLETPKTAIHHNGPVKFTSAKLDTSDLAKWSPEKVAQWMLNAGVELQFAEKFVENDINGAILITLKFEDLKELGIASFGVRTKIWDEVAKMKDAPRATSPDPETPIEDEPSREVKREQKRQDRREHGGEVKRSQSSRRRRHQNEDSVRPDQSVSIVGIEQVLPKPHHCSKGENCRKWRKQKRMIEAFKNDHPFVNMDNGGVVMIAGDPGNPQTARSIKPEDEVVFRPVSDAVPSLVASSDILGTEGLPALQYLQQATLRNAQAREQQNNIQQFLEMQHQIAGAAAEDVPPTPPFEMLPPRKAAPHSGLKALSKLSIPVQADKSMEEVPGSACPGSACPGSAYPPSAHTFGPPQPSFAAQQRQQSLPTPSPSPDSRSQTPTGAYRLGTPFSEMDVPVTQHYSMAPVARDVSQSVPPEMNYHTSTNPPPRSLSRSTFRRPSFITMPPVQENPAASVDASRRKAPSPIETAVTSPRSKKTRPLQAPPRAPWPWSPPATGRQFETAIAPIPRAPGSNDSYFGNGSSSGGSSSSSSSSSGASSSRHTPNSSVTSADSMANPTALDGNPKDLDGFQYQGYMKKRKTKMLRHEWQEQYVTLKGTRLAMHKDRREVDRTLEYVDIDDYAIACAGLASTSKLNAALKAMSIRKDKGMTKEDIAAFSFQLIPQAPGDARGNHPLRLRKRESSIAGGHASAAAAAAALPDAHRRNGSLDDTALPPPPPPEASNGTGKTHHFAVRSRDERIDWMRELMLAKALRQKKDEGFEINVNGKNVI